MIELKNFLANATFKNTLLITDFDGTTYRGTCPFLFRGISNADLGLALWLLSISNIRKFGLLSWKLVHLFFLERRLRHNYRKEKITLSYVDEQLIRFFASNVLALFDEKDLDKAAGILCRFCYKDAWKCFMKLREKCSFVTVSKSFEFLLRKLKEKTYESYKIEFDFHGVKTTGGKISKNSVVTRDDKYREVTQLLKNTPHFRKAVIMGDTEDDIAMRDAAIQVLGKSNVFFIAVNPRDEKVTAASDRTFKSWNNMNLNLE